MAEPSVRTDREDWVRAAVQILTEEGAGEVKVLTLARRMGCSRSNVYWFFKDREALLADSLAHWQAKNTAAIVGRANRPAARISQGVLNIFDCWADPDLFDARLDFAIREWARQSDAVATEVALADTPRLDAIVGLLTRFGASRTQAIVRARTLYFMQIGYYALGIREILELLLVLLPDLQRVCPERILHAPLGIIHPSFDLPARKVIGPARLGNRRLALDDLNHQRRLPLRRPPFDAVFHHHTHRYLLLCSMSRLSVGQYKTYWHLVEDDQRVSWFYAIPLDAMTSVQAVRELIVAPLHKILQSQEPQNPREVLELIKRQLCQPPNQSPDLI